MVGTTETTYISCTSKNSFEIGNIVKNNKMAEKFLA